MARLAHGDQPDADLDLPTDEVAGPPVAPASPSAVEEPPPASQTTSRPVGSNFSDLGSTLSGTARAPVDAAQQSALGNGAQAAGSIAHHTNDLTAVQNNLLAELNTGQFSGAALGHVQAMLSDITSAISAANASASAAGSFGNAAGAEQALRVSQLSVINAVSTDPVLASPAPAAPLPTGTPAPAAPHNLAEIGAIFDDVASQILGGVNDGNRAQITDDINAVISDMQALMTANPELFDGLTGVHADEIVQQLQLELVYINDPAISPTAAQASVDNILDIIDIIQSDANLADMATQDGIGGLSPLPDDTSPAPKYLDNDVQTAFVANFIAQSNSLGKQAVDLVGSQDSEAIAALIGDLRTFEKSVTDFDADLGGILGAEIAAMIKGLQTGNATLVVAAADQMHGNAADAGGNNIPVTGGTYNPDGLTVAEVLGTPVAQTSVAETPAALAAAASLDVQQVAAPTISGEPVMFATADVETGGADQANSDMPELAHHLHHMWG
ncbi:hypothetical protein [Bradyrhizobium sp. LMTR 3]|uniref:hypothetical protein n=1 Tax=Bradyrhizobium sp. LMTR 3 TaxID=189873 RepID=UPI0008104D1B|nr:hypothetical protein [Bradyrhizobium sp. LMTR 3]OCK61866.1 hypothetical protein LMTR3_31575 [Bradyrhizobium sp. LMTR 3]